MEQFDFHRNNASTVRLMPSKIKIIRIEILFISRPFHSERTSLNYTNRNSIKVIFLCLSVSPFYNICLFRYKDRIEGSVRMRETTGQKKHVFWHILCAEVIKVTQVHKKINSFTGISKGFVNFLRTLQLFRVSLPSCF